MANSKRKCKYCREYFPSEDGIKVPAGWFCSFGHATEFARSKARRDTDRKQRKEYKEAKEKLKTLSDHLREAQQAFNAYIRERDKSLPCISCGRPDDGTHQRHASHFRSVKSSPQLRFNLFNVHASCAQCNTYMSGNLISYRERLPKKIGELRFEIISTNSDIKRYSIEYAKRAKLIFRKKQRLYKKLFR